MSMCAWAVHDQIFVSRCDLPSCTYGPSRAAQHLVFDMILPLGLLNQCSPSRAAPRGSLACCVARPARALAARAITMRAWPVARSIFDAPYVREANERTTSWITRATGLRVIHCLLSLHNPVAIALRAPWRDATQGYAK